MLDSSRIFNSGGKGESRDDIYVLQGGQLYSAVVPIIDYVSM